jgi:hypothetical protein
MTGTGAAAAGLPEHPWPTSTAFITTGSILPISAIGTYALLKGNRRKLLLWGMLWGALTTVSRREICARCPYYGEYCSTLMGKITPLMWPRSDKPLTTQGFYWDIALAPALLLYPMPQVHRHSRQLLAAYLAAWILYLATMYNLACKRCPLTMCPFNPNR